MHINKHCIKKHYEPWRHYRQTEGDIEINCKKIDIQLWISILGRSFINNNIYKKLRNGILYS